MKHLCPCVQPFWLQLLFLDLILASIMGDADSDDDPGRNKADPSIRVSDLEKCLERYFLKTGYRNMQEVLDLVKESNATWKSAAKAILCKARLIGFDLIVGVFSLLSLKNVFPVGVFSLDLNVGVFNIYIISYILYIIYNIIYIYITTGI